MTLTLELTEEQALKLEQSGNANLAWTSGNWPKRH